MAWARADRTLKQAGAGSSADFGPTGTAAARRQRQGGEGRVSPGGEAFARCITVTANPL